MDSADPELHLLLQRQIKKLGVNEDSIPADVKTLLELISATYDDHEKDRLMLERSMEISSKELLRSNSEMRAILAGLPDVLYRIEKNGEVVDLDSRQVLCNITAPESRLVEKLHNHFNPETNRYLLSVTRNALEIRQETTVEYSIDQSGTTCYEMRLAPLIDDSLIAIIRDISDIRRIAKKLEKARDQAEAANKSKSLFLANMSHEVRTPISGITGMTELLQKTELSPHQQALIDMLKSSSINLMAIIDDILDISRAEVSGIELHCADFSLRSTIQATIKQVLGASRSKPGRIAVTLPDSIPDRLHGDRARISQILINLLGNAVKFSGSDSVVELDIAISDATTASEDGIIALKFDVSDKGIGIKEADLTTIFRPFFQLEQPRKAQHKGVGLGLSITKRLVGLMKGELSVQSQSGAGSTFTAILPLKVVELNMVRDSRPPARPSDEELPPARILVAEDNSVNRTHIRHLLRGLGMRTTIVENGRQAVEQVCSNSFDLVLMDCRMPELDGWDATRQIRRHEDENGTRQPLPIVALTANAMKGDRETCLEAGMTDYLAKPIDEGQLIAMLRTHIHQGTDA